MLSTYNLQPLQKEKDGDDIEQEAWICQDWKCWINCDSYRDIRGCIIRQSTVLTMLLMLLRNSFHVGLQGVKWDTQLQERDWDASKWCFWWL